MGSAEETGMLPQSLTAAILRINKKFGKNLIHPLSEQPPVEFISTGVPELDYLTAWKLEDGETKEFGIPKGFITEIFGVPGAGKTTVCYQIISRYSYALFINAEGTLNRSLAYQYGIDGETCKVLSAASAEQSFYAAIELAKIGIPLLVIDSIPFMTPRSVIEESDYDKVGAMGILARLLSSKISYLQTCMQEFGTTTVLVNQVRANIGGFGPMAKQPQSYGGWALKHAVALRLRVSRLKRIEDSKLGVVGQICKIIVDKSKVGPTERRSVEAVLLFQHGFVSHNSVDTIIAEDRQIAGYKARKVVTAKELDEEEENENAYLESMEE